MTSELVLPRFFCGFPIKDFDYQFVEDIEHKSHSNIWSILFPLATFVSKIPKRSPGEYDT